MGQTPYFYVVKG